MEDNKYFSNEDLTNKEKTEYENIDYSNLTEKQLTSIVQKYIDELVDKLDKGKPIDENIVVDYKSTITDYFNKSKEAYNFDEILAKNNFAQSLLDSKDVSTQNLGKILMFLYKKNLLMYSKLYKLVIDRISFSNGELIFVDGKLDVFRTESCLAYLQFVLSDNKTIPLAEAFIVDLVTGTNHDYEFAALHSFLKNFTNDVGLDRLDDILSFMKDCYEKGNKEHTIDNLRKLVNLIVNGLVIETARDSGFYDPNTDKIFLDDICCTSVVAMHEFGHAIDKHYSHRDKTKQDRELFRRAREHFLNHPNAVSIVKKIAKVVQNKGEEIGRAFDKQMIKTYGSYEKAIDHFEEYAINAINNGTLNQLFVDYNMPNSLVNSIESDFRNRTLNPRNIAINLYDLSRNNLINRAQLNMHETSFLDIISSIFGGYDIRLRNGNYVDLGFGHDSAYFSQEPDLPMCEIYANLNSLLVHNKTNFLSLIRELAGEEFYEYIMKDHDTDRIPDYVPEDGSRKKVV